MIDLDKVGIFQGNIPEMLDAKRDDTCLRITTRHQVPESASSGLAVFLGEAEYGQENLAYFKVLDPAKIEEASNALKHFGEVVQVPMDEFIAIANDAGC